MTAVRSRATTVAGVVGGVVTAAAVVCALVRGDVLTAVATLAFASYLAVGLVICRHQPRHVIGWMFVVVGTLSGLQYGGGQAALIGVAHRWPDGAVRALAWWSTWAWFPAIFVPITVALLRFPDGRLPGRRWRVAEVAGWVAIGLYVVGAGVPSATLPAGTLLATGTPTFTGWRGIFFAAALVGFVAMGPLALATVASVVVRWRRSDVVQRQQVRWVITAAVVAVLLEAGVDVPGNVTDVPPWVQTVAESGGFSLIAVATGVAITRYRLYEIDRIVSRTVTYGSVLVVLAGVYVGVVAGLAALVPADLGQVGVAVATLVVSVLAVPLTRRVRAVVDRRFHRSRFDAERVVAAFATRLRARPDATDVPADLVDVLQRTVQPAHAGVWLVPR